jgi:hypothetical protein
MPSDGPQRPRLIMMVVIGPALLIAAVAYRIST